MTASLVPDDLRTCHSLLRAAVRALSANTVLPLGDPLRLVPPLEACVLSGLVSPALNLAIGRGQISGDEGVRQFLSLLERGVDAESALRRWIIGLRFLARHLDALVSCGVAVLTPIKPEMHHRYWMFFALADLDPLNRVPAYEDCMAYIDLLDDEDEFAPDGAPWDAAPRLRTH